MRFSGYWQVLRGLGPVAAVRNMVAKRRTRRGERGWLRSKNLQHPVLFRQGSTDLGVFAQIFITLEYLCFSDLVNPELIIDLGANVGYSAAYFLSRFKDAFLICVEPDAENFKLLEQNLAPYRDRCILIQAAVWPEMRQLWLDPATMGEENEWGRQVSDRASNGVPVEAVDIESLVAMTPFKRISILKVDIEGAEKELLSHNYQPWLDRTDNFCIEIHGPECRKALDRAIAGQGYALSHSGELTVGKRGR